MRRNTEAERWRAIGTLQTGSMQVQAAIVMDILQSGVSRLWVHSKSGYTVIWRLMSTCRRDDRLVVKEALRNRYFTSTDMQQYLRRVRGVAISRQTISNHVHAGGVSARRPQVVLPFAARHRRARLAWCI